MTDNELDTAYTALAHALTRAGEARAPLFLSILCLSLLSRQPRRRHGAAADRAGRGGRSGSTRPERRPTRHNQYK